MSITSITELTAEKIATRFKTAGQRYFFIDRKQYSSIDVLTPGMKNRVVPDRWVFDENDNFVSRSVVVEKPQGGFREILSEPFKKNGFVTTIKDYNALGEESGEAFILHKVYELRELVDGIKRFMVSRKYVPDTVVNYWAKNTKDGYQRAAISAYTKGGNIDVVRDYTGVQKMKVAAIDESDKEISILTDVIEDTAPIDRRVQIFEVIEPGLKKIKDYLKTASPQQK